ncbi:NPCBM/NEW2 domain-containing protein [Deinococcus sp.]|uniref:NPCBM/NEW2 domain-containing protein n=1 Tax=Deinococcus sp. TaxID=47478 RepID=UPI003B596854
MRRHSLSRFGVGTLGLGLVLSACGQSSVSPLTDPYAGGVSYPWTYTAPESKLSAQSLTAGENNLFFEPILAAQNAWGPIELDRSNGEQKAGDGKTITLGGKKYTRGFGTHAGSELRFSLVGTNGAVCTRFTADIGIDAEVGRKGSVVFQVFLDGVKAYDSGVMRGSSATKQVDVPINGQQQLRLVVTDAGDGISYDHADWAIPKVFCQTGVTPAPGTLDTSFIANGFGGISPVVKTVLTPDGKIVGAGLDTPYPGEQRLKVKLLNANGSLNTGLDFGGGSRVAVNDMVTESANSVLVLSTGYQKTPPPDTSNQPAGDFQTVQRVYLDNATNRTPPRTFDGAIPGTKAFSKLALQPDGKIILGGVTEDGKSVRLRRMTADGVPDSTFGVATGTNLPRFGEVVTKFNGAASVEVSAMIVQPDGKIIVGGVLNDPDDFSGGSSGGFIIRYQADGQLDSGFATGGIYLSGGGRYTGNGVSDFALQRDGKLLVALLNQNRCSFLRLNGDGQGDLSFRVDLYEFTGVDFEASTRPSLAIQEDGRAVVAGCGGDVFAQPLIRLGVNGAVDLSFAQADQAAGIAYQNILIQPKSLGGKIIVGLDTLRRFVP